ncbi:MAG: hypothetical protein J1E79_03870 [Rikenella sp.]|nr:hypothetical protein [Rikenella sp.]
MAKRTESTKKSASKIRGTFSVVLTREDNDLLRDYRYTQIMRTHNTELSLVDITDQFFDIFREEYKNNRLSSVEFRDSEKAAVVKEFRTVLGIRTEDFDLLKQYKLDHILHTGNIEFTMTQAIQHVFEVVRQKLKAQGYALMSRPEIVRNAEIRKRNHSK